MLMTGAEAIIQSLKNEEVDVVFGYPGGSVLTLYDALYQANFRHILTKHEQGAIHAADGYARATGKVGVVIATSGPGATNLVTGIATAYMDSIPLVAITGQVSVPLIGRDSFQEADIRGITTPITKHNYLVKNVEDLPSVLKEAFYIARTGRPGPVVVDIAKDVFAASLDYEYPPEVKLRGYRPVFAGDSEILDKVFQEMKLAKKPLLFVGGGVNLSDSAEELRNLVNRSGFPVISSLMGLGCIPYDHPQYLGMVGMHGTYAANMATTECDLMIGIGVRFDDRVTGLLSEFAPKAKIIHFDIDPAEINKNVLAHIRVIGDLKWSLPELSLKVKDVSGVLQEQVRPWLEKVRNWYQEKPLTYVQGSDSIMPQEVVKKVSDLTQGDAVIVTDVGQHQMWVAQFYGFKNSRSLLTSGGLGTMGYGLPAALGAQCGMPDKAVILFVGDGGVMMNCQELVVLAEHNFPVKVLIFNNQVLGMVAQWQRMFYGARYSHTSLKASATDFVKLAEAMGVAGLRVTKPEELDKVLEQALAIPGPVVVDIRIPEVLDVFPMVPAGACLDEMMLGGTEG
ncbi:acetolactate synthase, large subunit, biosynthetic type [Desulfosporosinus orientis DSM 765]|uniref:Acetolactate synthase n=1 Tax=Desulfosporosinus orientis (strain ATCC 19365 / DSM 765 / NCIMB 8382 / VKM B-1628 / Singapore I) TaxID=768706 RepID=G7WFV4_DESOD|nr:biosynthetic-type acetolactate synthase large subunit [Desulfosporosinus orientis]AET69469.1 acetolactate synthase, large subunit, biosynthetic type [Desulfosporosinus orientis DSM 765]